jgi:hypothetical protein
VKSFDIDSVHALNIVDVAAVAAVVVVVCKINTFIVKAYRAYFSVF